MSNQSAYEARDIVKHYASLSHLQKPEQIILDSLSPNLKNMKMLDIGVGAGRTTLHFARLTEEYVGIDYSANMIKFCEKKFQTYGNVSFKACDVRSMKIFRDNYFDFVLFSYNGIDYISHADRLIALREIKRVCKDSALFCFSTHNLRSIEQLFAVQSSDLARILYRKWFRNLILMLLNENLQELKVRPYAIIRDGTHWFRLKTYYIKPAEQVRQLENLGFENIRLYQLDGKEVGDSPILQNTVTDHWIYYLCNAS